MRNERRGEERREADERESRVGRKKGMERMTKKRKEWKQQEPRGKE